MIVAEEALNNSSVSVPSNPGSTNPADTCVNKPIRPTVDLPSNLPAKSAGIRKYSSVAASWNDKGGITTGDCKVRSTEAG